MKPDSNSRGRVEARGAVERLVQASRLLLEQGSLLLPGTSLSIKVEMKDPFGAEEEMLQLLRLGWSPREAGPADLFAVQAAPLSRLTALDSVSDRALVDYVEKRSVGTSRLPVYREALLHAVVPGKCVVHVYPDTLLAMVNTPTGSERVRNVYGSSELVLSHAEAGLPLAKACAAVLSRADKQVGALVLMHQGVLGFGPTLEEASNRALELAKRAEAYLSRAGIERESHSRDARQYPPQRDLLALRRGISERVGCPVILRAGGEPGWVSFAQRDDLVSKLNQGPVPADVLGAAWGVLRRDELEPELEAKGASREDADGEVETASIPLPGVVIDPATGLAAFARTASEAEAVAELCAHVREVILMAEALDGYEPPSSIDRSEAGLPWAEPGLHGAAFTGEVALVTGAASGIGQGCVQAFLDRGAAVVGLDIDPSITGMLDRPDFLGLECDVTDAEAVRQALRTTLETYGGLDMLVPNAGMFPPGRRIDALSREEWDRVMEVNLDANLAVLREAHPLLKASPKGGRVVIMGSRNVPAPGPGAVAYSVSKAGLVQMGRVAALEWGGDGIRVNIINPHAVFDTGIWTDEVLQARADHYGLTVDEYKTRNVLGVEVTSRDVGELVAEMCGPLFDKTTGAQIPIDGGSERVV